MRPCSNLCSVAVFLSGFHRHPAADHQERPPRLQWWHPPRRPASTPRPARRLNYGALATEAAASARPQECQSGGGESQGVPGDTRRVEQGDNNNGAKVIEDGQGRRGRPSTTSATAAQEGEDTERERNISRRRNRPATQGSRIIPVEGARSTGTTMPPSAAMQGKAARLTDEAPTSAVRV